MSLRRFALFFAGVLLLSACSAQTIEAPVLEATVTPEVESIAVEDDLGSAVELEGYPQAIVSLSPSTTEILFAIGAGDQVVGREDTSMYPEDALEVPSVGALWGELPTEAILAMEPDLIVGAEIISTEQVQTLKDLGLTVYWQSNPESFDDLYQKILDIAEITGHVDEANTLIASLKTRVAAVEETVANAEKNPTVFYQLDSTDPANPWTVGSGTFINFIITTAGGINVTADLVSYVQIGTEGLIAKNPDIILMADALYGITAESVSQRPGWEVINAVVNGAMYPIDPNMMSVPGPRLVDALEETARLLHPDLFK